MSLSVAGNLTALADTPDLKWSPEPFAFRTGRVARYIDFENGDDANPGTQGRPWKHHPWDPNAVGTAAEHTGVTTYCFKRGVAYRGALVAKESGRADEPIRLTVDSEWGQGRAWWYGSTRLRGRWRRCTAEACPDLPGASREQTWYLDLAGQPEPRMLWEVRDGQAVRIHVARSPNWTITDPDDPRGNWWELTGHVLGVTLELEDAAGFRLGDSVSGTGKWLDRDENRDNIPEGRNRVVQVEDSRIQVASYAWKKGELKKGAKITNGTVTTTIRQVLPEGFTDLRDDAHFPSGDGPDWTGATVWAEGANMPHPRPRKIRSVDRAAGTIRVLCRGARGAQTCCRYYVEGLPAFLDSPGEFCYVPKGEQAGRLCLRLPDDRDPNDASLEVGRERVLLRIQNQNHLEVSGLSMRFADVLPVTDDRTLYHARLHQGAVHVAGNCSHIRVRNCGFSHLPNAIQAYVLGQEDTLDHLAVTDCDIHDMDSGAICLTARGFTRVAWNGGGNLVHAKVMRNRVSNTGHRSLQGRSNGFHAITVEGGQMVEIAGNVVDQSWGCGIWAYNGMEERLNGISRPLVRVLVHHNKVTNSLLGLQDYGGIAAWMAGPCYVYNNISGNAVGYKHYSFRTLDRKDWYRTSCYGLALYFDGQYKGYAFNNILWGKHNDVNSRIYSCAAFNEAMGFMNTVFNNTMCNFAIGLHKGMIQHDRCRYLGNLMLDIGHKFIQQEPKTSIIEFDSLAYARNVFQGRPPHFGLMGGWGGGFTSTTLEEWRAELGKRRAMVTETGTLASGPQVADAAAHDFTLRPSSAAVDSGVKVFVPWGLYAVVGEWNFLRYPADPTVILGENVNWNDEWYYRSMFTSIPRNHLKGLGIDASNIRNGTLEDWTAGALELNGTDEYCQLTHAELTRDWSWKGKNYPRWVPKTHGTVDGKARETLDMGVNNFLVEIVFKTRPGLGGGGLACKHGDKGYAVELTPTGAVTMKLSFGAPGCARTSGVAVNDGQWHHVIAEVDRGRPEGVHLYVDGKPADGAWSGKMDRDTSLANTADFLVGKTPNGHYFAGQLDFLRVSRGTLANAETSIDELYRWQFDGPFLKDFLGRRPTGRCRDAGAVESVE